MVRGAMGDPGCSRMECGPPADVFGPAPACCSFPTVPLRLACPAHSDCDTPLSLINATLDWVAANLHDEVDFVVWTGDSARHDIDLAYPRSMPEIFALNRQLSTRIRDIFGKHVPIIPSFGNNDIYPHNIMFGGEPGSPWLPARRLRTR